MAINKIVLNTDSGEQVLVDLTGDNVTADTLVVGSVAHGADGEIVEGANPYKLDTTNAEVGTQTDLIAQISAALAGKATPSAGKPEQEKTLNVTQNDDYEVVPDGGYTLSKVTVNVNVPSDEPNIQPLNVTENGTYTPSGDVDGYGPVTVNVSGGSDADAMLDAIIDRTATSVSSNATKTGDYAFRNCTKLVTANLPNATSIGQHTFKYCNALKNVHIPKATTLAAYAFEDCGIQTLDLPVATSIAANAFNGSQLATLIIRTTSKVCTLANKNALTDTAIEDGTGYIYVPAALVDSYKVASNWSTFAAKFRAIEDYPEITGG